MEKYIMPEILDQRDTVHNAAYIGIAHLTADRSDDAEDYVQPVLYVLWKLFWPYKNPSYVWENSDGVTRFLARLFPGLRNIPKGLNGDQCLPMLIYLALTKNYYMVNKWFFGMILRSIVICVPIVILTKIGWGLALPLWWYPNGEFLILKPHHLAPMARLYRCKPLYWVLDFFAYISFKISLSVPISAETTDKIKIFPYLLLAENQPTFWTRRIKSLIKSTDDYAADNNWFRMCYTEYFKNHLINEVICFNVVKL